MSSADATSSLEHNLLRICCQTLDDKKAVDLKVLDVRGKSSLTDYLVIATGTSDPHLRALGGALQREFKNTGTPIIGAENDMKSGWLVVDAFDVMVHIFTPQMRELYRLEYLWKDAEVVDVSAWLTAEPAPVAAAPAKAEKAEKAATAKPKAEKAAKKAAPAKKAAAKKTAVKKTAVKKAAATKTMATKSAASKKAVAEKAETAAKPKKAAPAKKTAKTADKAPAKTVKKTAVKKVAKKAASKK